jgi:chromosome segregation ATPase
MQVQFHCVEQGRALNSLRERYAELANALHLGVTSLDQQHAALSGALLSATSAAAAAQAQVHSLRQQLAQQQEHAEDQQSALAACQARYKQLESESQEEVKQLQQLVQALRQQLWSSQEVAEASHLAAEGAAAAAQEVADARLAAAEDANQDLLQRMAFLNAQLAAVRLVLMQCTQQLCVQLVVDAARLAGATVNCCIGRCLVMPLTIGVPACADMAAVLLVMQGAEA